MPSASPTAPPSTGTKRKQPPSPVDEAQFALDSDDDGPVRVDQNCDQVRRRIHAYIDSRAMKVGDFCKAIGVSNKSYNDFLRQTGRDKGMSSNTYVGALQFFHKREAAGAPPPRKAARAAKTGGAEGGGAAAGAAAAGKGAKGEDADVGGVRLDGEDEDAVEIYDTCDELRRKINAHLKKPGVTQAAFLRALSAQYRAQPRKIQSAQLGAFRGKKGPNAGNSSCVYYAAYVFFEKLRIKEGKKKSKHREEMERIYGREGGVSRERTSGGFFCRSDEYPVEDKYGQLRIVKGPPRKGH